MTWTYKGLCQDWPIPETYPAAVRHTDDGECHFYFPDFPEISPSTALEFVAMDVMQSMLYQAIRKREGSMATMPFPSLASSIDVSDGSVVVEVQVKKTEVLGQAEDQSEL